MVSDFHRSLMMFFILVLVLSFPALCFGQAGLPVQDRADIVGSSGGHFWVRGEPLRFIGYNVRGFVHYGGGDLLYWSSAQDRISSSQVVTGTGGKVIRVFVSNRYLSNQEVGDRLETALNLAQSQGFYVLCSLIDYYRTGFHPLGDAKYYTQSGDYSLLNHEFFSGGFRENYLPQVRYLVNRFKHHKGVFAWQLGNEIKHPQDPTVFYNFCMEMHQAIREIDPYHMISVGLISTYPHTGWTTEQARNIHSTFDFLTVHVYNGASANDHEWASTLRKPLIVGEAGFSSGNRPQSTSNDIAKWVGLNARGYLQWGLMSSLYDNGDGDRMFGVDRVFHADDWNAYLQTYSTWAQQLSNTPVPPSEKPMGVKASQGTYAGRVLISWDFEPSAKQYAVFRSASPGDTGVQISTWQADISYEDITAIPGVTYYYRVKAKNNGGESALSDYAAGYADASTYGAVEGYVLDINGNPVSDALVTLYPGLKSVTSQTDGYYRIDMVGAGSYDMSVIKSGFRPGNQYGVTVTEEQTTNVSFVLNYIDTASQAKSIADGNPAAVGGIVTAKFSAGGQQFKIYVQSPGRSGGIGVITNASVSIGDEVLADGNMTTLDGERVLQATDLLVIGAGEVPKPVSMTNKALGGGWIGMQSAVIDNASTGAEAVGLSNIGVLARSWGRVTHVDSGAGLFYMDDGSGIRDGSGRVGVRVACTGLPFPSAGWYVSITGISGATIVNGKVARILRPRSLSDLSYADLIALLSNPGFETGTTAGWTVYGDVDGVISGSWYGGITAHSGTYFIGSAANWGSKNGGVYQRVAVPNGMSLQAKAWSRVYRMDNASDAAQNRIGIDPTGGTNPTAPAVQWSDVDMQPIAGYSEWRQLITPIVQSTSGYVTVFLDIKQPIMQGWKANCFDDAELSIIGP